MKARSQAMKRFGPFRLDSVNQCLWQGEQGVAITPKAFDVLRYLVERPGRLVTQEEILESLWPGTYVNQEVIKKYILAIRRVLGDRHDERVFVETVPRRGYQFVAEVIDESGGASSPFSADAKTTVVGRHGQLARLDGALGQALHGGREVVFVTGEAGIGKTTLVDLFQQNAVRRSMTRIARGQCVEGFGGKEAYYPMLEALGQLASYDGGLTAKILAAQAPTWLIQFPSLVKPEQRDALQREILGATRERMVREMCEALEALTLEQPLVLVLDDLHWSDPSTVDLISALARRREAAKLLLLCAYRPMDVAVARHPLRSVKEDLLAHHLCEEIALERLEESEIAEYLATEFAAASFTAGLATMISRQSGGNALFMVALVQDLAKNRVIVRDDSGWKLTMPLNQIKLGVPQTLLGTLQVQFEHLAEPEQRILRSASVAGERFS